MRLLITGVCGFVGSALAAEFHSRNSGRRIHGVDNLMRPGSEGNRQALREQGVEFVHGDLRCASDVDALPACDWVIDAAANPSVLAGVSGQGSRQLFEHNLSGMINVLEYCKRHRAGLLLLSSSRVYSIEALSRLPLRDTGSAFALDTSADLPAGVSPAGIGTAFSTTAPISLYGATKLASETIALEYGAAFDFPVWITRCGVLAGPGQFGTPDQGIFAYWINAFLAKRPLKFIGFDGMGKQVRDALHPRDLATLLESQIATKPTSTPIYTAGGGVPNTISLRELHDWCAGRFGHAHIAVSDPTPRPFDIPWVAMDNSAAQRDFGWTPRTGIHEILEEIAQHALRNPGWLQRSGLSA